MSSNTPLQQHGEKELEKTQKIKENQAKTPKMLESRKLKQ